LQILFLYDTYRQRATRCQTDRAAFVGTGNKAFPVELPDEHDPNSFFVSGGGDAQQFRLLLQRAHS